MGLINWCDSKISELKSKNFSFINGMPIVPENMRVNSIPQYIETYQFRNEIPLQIRKKSLICFYSNENRLWNRLKTIEEDCGIFSEYLGIVGMDISPSVNMLRPRQLHSILINNIYDCLVASRGIKVAINSRIGDLGTDYLINSYPKNKTLVFGNIGCNRIFSNYSFWQFKKWIKIEKPKHICVYGSYNINKLLSLDQDICINFYANHNYKKLTNRTCILAKVNKDKSVNYRLKEINYGC